MAGQAVTHLYRGAAAVRDWSRYQKTITEWTLCGIRRNASGEGFAIATEDHTLVTCRYCRQLLGATQRKTLAARG